MIERIAAAVRDGGRPHRSPRRAGSEAAFRAYGDYFTRFEAAPVVIVPSIGR